jgi:hypothetical protein
MQSLWANVLAGQANKPGSFSKRTIDLVATLDKSDAEMFRKFCTFVWRRDINIPIIENINKEIFKNAEINFATLSHLNDIGLINFNHFSGFLIEQLPKVVTLHYYDAPINIELPKENNNVLKVGEAILTRAGQELAAICGSVSSEEYFMDTLESWIQQGYFLTSPL